MRTAFAFTFTVALVASLAIPGCKSDKKKPDTEAAAATEPATTPPGATAPSTPPATAVEPSAAAPAPADPAAPAAAPEPGAKPAGKPIVTRADLKKKGLKAFVDPARGVRVVEGGKPTQLCGAAASKQVATWQKLLAAAESLAADGEFPEVFECEGHADRTVCAYQHPASDEAYAFVFAPGAKAPVLAALVNDSSSDQDADAVSLEPCSK